MAGAEQALVEPVHAGHYWRVAGEVLQVEDLLMMTPMVVVQVAPNGQVQRQVKPAPAGVQTDLDLAKRDMQSDR